MMVLSSGLASLGLLEGSTAVVIGAMLALVLLLPLMLNVEEQKRRGGRVNR